MSAGPAADRVMSTGIALPSYLSPAPDRSLLLDWTRQAEQHGFATVATLDKPRSSSWDPIVALAAAACVTSRVRLLTGILQLPNRPTGLVAQQAAAIDVLCQGRLDLGVAIGARRSDYEFLRAPYTGRAARFEQQLAELRAHWRRAQRDGADPPGLAPFQRPHPPVLIGGTTPGALARACRLGDGVVLAPTEAAELRRLVPDLRAQAAAAGRAGFRVVGQAWVALGPDGLEQARHQLTRFFGPLWADPAEFVAHGPVEAVAAALRAYAETGLDELVLLPLVPQLDQVAAAARAASLAGLTSPAPESPTGSPKPDRTSGRN